MDCPFCKNPMIIIELDEVETDYCADCGGIWLDAGELELLFADAAQANQLIASFRQAAPDEKIHLCPICLKKMQKVLVADAGKPIIIDRCPKGHGLWFDRGELAQILTRGDFDKEKKIIKLLSDIFGKNETEGENGN
ncbi:MAG: zf-TFIIB domain-containing protein [Phycisphaerae bacterium]|nr:zf-TFIIB domain-containing protein [Phycisphaerae bacterium]